MEQSLRADVERYVEGRLGALREEVERLQGQLTEALSRLRERFDEPADEGNAPLTVAISDHLRNARNEGIEAANAESSRARASSDIALIKAAVDDLEAQHTQADILNALVNRAAAFAPRVAFFVVKNERATGWRARGLEGTVGDDAVRELSLPLSADTLLGEVARTRSTWSGAAGSHAEDTQVYGHFGGEPPQRLVAVPLVAREKAVAVLYADSAEQDADAVNLEALETIVRVAGMSVELLAARRPGGAGAEAATAPARPQEAPPRPREAPARSQEPPAPTPPAPPAERFGAPTPPEPPRREPAPEPEPPTPPRAVPEPAFTLPRPESPFPEAAAEASAPPATPLGSSRRYGAADMEFPVEVSEADKRYHNEARRFARLLVSEIKLYNEDKVRRGRDEGDLYSRLREDIDRSRQMYDKRVRPEVSSRYDYFHHELVNMLAEGDQHKLGQDYPGATVAS
ncbi:MAG TPA: GAF domain-containing protein [Pyrinomonadaceae bacterium]|nr:GAF domain-containing protein [Pyrinomonadaceae bacterium]